MSFRNQCRRSSIVSTAVFITCAVTMTPPHAESAGTEAGTTLTTLVDAIAFAEVHDPAMRAFSAQERAARAQRSEARALPNPEVSLSSKQGGGETFGKNMEAEFHVNFGGVVGTPWRLGEADARARAAQARVDETRAARRFEVAQAWYRALAAQAIGDLEAAAASTWQAQAELTRRQRDAGTVNALDLAETEAIAHEARLTLRRATQETEEASAALAGVIGAAPKSLAIAGTLPPLPASEPSREALWHAAEHSDPTLAALRAEALAAQKSQAREQIAALPRLSAGATYERDGRGHSSLAPEVGLEIPLFNLGFARRAKARAEREAATHRVAAQEAELEASLSQLESRLNASREAHVAWRDTLVPLRRRAAEEALRHYNFMLVGADRLLALRRYELEAERARVESLHDYWLARAALDRLTGSLKPRGPHTPPNTNPSSETDETRHNHE